MSCFKLAFDDFLNLLFDDPDARSQKPKKIKCINCKDKKQCFPRCACRCHVRSCSKCDNINCNYLKCKCGCHQLTQAQKDLTPLPRRNYFKKNKKDTKKSNHKRSSTSFEFDINNSRLSGISIL